MKQKLKCVAHIEDCEGSCPAVVAQWQSTGAQARGVMFLTPMQYLLAFSLSSIFAS